MSQQDISDFLKKHNRRWFTAREIAKNLNISIGTTIMNCKRIRPRNDIKIKFVRPMEYRYNK